MIPEPTPGILQVHETTIPHLDIIEKAILDELIRQGRAAIVAEN
jgi:hypothetical protein